MNLPNGITEIEESCFIYARNIKSISLPKTIAHIGKYAFYGCNNLCDVIVLKDNFSIGEYAFAGCHLENVDSKSVRIKKGYFLSDDKKTILYGTNVNITDIIIPEGIEHISDYAFYRYHDIVNISLPKSIKSIGRLAFIHADKEITIHNGPSLGLKQIFKTFEDMASN